MKKIVTILLSTIIFTITGKAQVPELIKDISSISSLSFIDPPSGYVEFNGKVYFAATDSIHHRELWSTDGTAAGTSILKELNPGPAGQVHFGVPYFGKDLSGILNGELFFNGFDSTHAMALWKTDGTANGTVLVKDISPQGVQPFIFQEPVSYYFNEINGKLVFISSDSMYGEELWVTDGTTSGTQLLKDINSDTSYNNGSSELSDFVMVGGKLYFTANDSTHGTELWVTDGTTSGTQLFVDLDTYHGYPNNASFSSSPRALYEFNNELYFIAYNDGFLYKTDGTISGTVVLSDSANNWSPKVQAQTSYSNAPQKYFTEMNGKLYFIGKDTAYNHELWVSDGTFNGTQVVKEINSDPTRIALKGEITSINNNQLLFFANASAITDFHLWQSDGTANGTTQVKKLITNTNPQEGKYMYEYKNKIFFHASHDTYFRSWWVTDGTTGGTHIVDTGFNFQLGKPITYNDRMYLVRSAQGGKQLWESEGDSSTTKIIYPIGDTTSSITLSFGEGYDGNYDYIKYNGSLIFTADYGLTGNEPYILKTIPLKVISYNKEEIGLLVYPNPTRSELSVVFNEPQNQELQFSVRNIEGKVMQKGIIQSGVYKQNISLENYPLGVYLIQIGNTDGIQTIKVLKE